MTLQPQTPSANPAFVLPEVPGLAYYTALAAKPARQAGPPKRTPAAEALDAMYGYYSPQD